MVTLLKGSLSEKFDLLLEGELFNGSKNYLTGIVIDTGFNGLPNETPIIIPDNICKELGLVKSKKTLEIWGPLKDKPTKCHTANLGVRLKEDNVTKFEKYSVTAIILPCQGNGEIIVGPDFLVKVLECKRIIVDYEKYSLTLVI